MEGYGTMPGAAMACMTASLLIAFGPPLGLGLFFRRRGGRWRAFLLGAAVFLVFALVLEQRAHQLILGGPAGGVITGDLGLYALYGGLMAGLFEETGRFAAFQLLRRSGKGGTPQDALIYGAGHGGMEAVLLVGLTNVSNLLLSFWLNTGTLEQHMGQLDDAAAQALAAAVAAQTNTYLWGGLERIVAVAIHISLSVLVWRAVERRASLWLFPAAIALHAGVDACAILAAAHMPLAGVELVALVWAVALAVLARWIWRQREKKSL